MESGGGWGPANEKFEIRGRWSDVIEVPMDAWGFVNVSSWSVTRM